MAKAKRRSKIAAAPKANAKANKARAKSKPSKTKAHAAKAAKSTKSKAVARSTTSAQRATRRPSARAFIGTNHAGRISTVLLDMGGLLGVEDKIVAVPLTSLVVKGRETGAQLFVMDLSQKAAHRALLPSVEEPLAGNIGDKALEFSEKATATASALTAGTISTIADMSHRAAAASGPLAEQAIETLTIAKDSAAKFGH
jgi:hypothetical protein